MTRSPHKSSAEFVARVALMASLALIFSYVEAIIPYNPGIPGIKLGIANVVTVVALYKFGAKDAAAVSVIRIVLAGLLFNGLFGMLYSLAGAVLSLAGMILLKKTDRLSCVAVSVIGGVLHNAGQILMAWALMGANVVWYLPVLILSGTVAGIAIGLVSAILVKRIKL